jgi:tripartite motif-containing protein 71
MRLITLFRRILPVLTISLGLLPLACGPNYNTNPQNPNGPSYPVQANSTPYFYYSMTYGDTGIQGTGNGQFNTPTGLAFYNNGLFVADGVNNKIQKFDLLGNYLATIIGGGGGFNGPMGLAFNQLNLMFVADSGNNRVQTLDVYGNYIGSFGTAGSGLGQFNNPMGLAVDKQSNVYVADNGNNRLEKCGPTGTGCVTVGGFTNVTSVALDSSGNVWAADAGAQVVKEFSSGLTFISQFGTAGTGAGQFQSPVGITVDAKGYLIVADSVNENVQQFNSNGTFIQSVGIQGPGQKPGQFTHPHYLATTPYGTLFVGDWGNYTVLQFQFSYY